MYIYIVCVLDSESFGEKTPPKNRLTWMEKPKRRGTGHMKNKTQRKTTLRELLSSIWSVFPHSASLKPCNNLYIKRTYFIAPQESHKSLVTLCSTTAIMTIACMSTVIRECTTACVYVCVLYSFFNATHQQHENLVKFKLGTDALST